MLKIQSGKYKVFVRKSKVPKMYFLRPPARQNGLKGKIRDLSSSSGNFEREKEQVFSHKLIRLVLKSRIVLFNPFCLAWALKNYMLRTLDLRKMTLYFPDWDVSICCSFFLSLTVPIYVILLFMV